MRKWLRRHRWNGLNVLGAVLLLWVGLYLYWRLQASFSPYRGPMVILVPGRVAQSMEPLFRPLVRIDQWITGETILFTGWELGNTF